ncbi:neutral/alkaline non-lysosomal ceramidase N-terminal domain-containing protein [Rossellomorea aquimaris]|uniref:neutral/alkaline non-lysosomal ceramidase N-terminal domain-containing protein n=1 Tax=Rossellomorea aquimaris TaxID=189382 RepID=UPI0007D07A68|nr:neutral/alkaline non-lysosomal ceramidase N-terminal domain-containing protein [Rossellomorea aquimaris]
MSKVGVCKLDITPPLGIDFIGYHRPSGIQNIEEKIYTTVFVFESNETKTVLVSIDNIGLLIEDTLNIRNQIREKLKLPLEHIMVTYTHTHSGPATANNSQVVVSYKESLIKNTVKAAVKASENMDSSGIGWDVTHGQIGVNRREISSSGKVIMGTNENGVVDNRIGVLGMKHPSKGNMQGIIVFCTAHPNVLKGDSDRLSADYPGRAREILEHKFNCPVAIIQGASGNVNARYRGSEKALQKMATLLSNSVITMIPYLTYESIFTLKMKSTTIPLELKQIPNPKDIKAMARLAQEQWGVNTDKWAATLMDKHRRNEKNCNIDLEIQLLQLNEGVFSGIPMEPFSETALEIQGRLHSQLAFFGGFTNGYLGYLPTKEAYPLGGYEVELNPVVYGPITSLWMPPEENMAETIVERVLELYHERSIS